LSRAALEVPNEKYRRVDLQLVAMIADARATLHAEHVDVDAKVLLRGFSASGMFVNRFALLHPEVVRAVAVSSPGGWPIAPSPEVDGEALRYPVGIADVATLTGKAVDLAAARHVSWLFLLGDKDENDAVPHRDSFSSDDERLVFRRFGSTPVSRWRVAEGLYKSAGLDARFTSYPGVAHVMTPEMDRDVARFFAELAASP
jgi:pimeloyl-ACP methyl ester carboxylesterase